MPSGICSGSAGVLELAVVAPESKPQEEHGSEASQAQESGGSETVTVPDLGDIDAAEIIEVNVAVGDELEQEQVIVVVESNKAPLEIPSPSAGKVESVAVKVGDKVGTGDALLIMSVLPINSGHCKCVYCTRDIGRVDIGRLDARKIACARDHRHRRLDYRHCQRYRS